MELISIAVNVVLLIAFFIMASNLGNIRRILASITPHIPILYSCGKCKGQFQGKHPKCPHCETKINY